MFQYFRNISRTGSKRTRSDLILIGILCCCLLSVSSVSAQSKSKPALKIPTGKHFFETELKTKHSQAWFRIPTECPAYGVLTIDYRVWGTDLHAAVEANAFENTGISILRAYSNSALPLGVQLDIKYKGSYGVPGLGKEPVAPQARLRKFFSSQSSYLHLFQVINSGDCIMKSQGMGMVSYRIRVADASGKILEWGDRYMQLSDQDLYPGDTASFSCIIDPLPQGKYTLQIVANLHSSESLDGWDAGPVIARTDIPIEVPINDPSSPGLSIPEIQPVLPLKLFPDEWYHWEEFLQTIQVHSLDTEPVSGKLALQMRGDSGFINVKLVSESGIGNAGWNINVIPNSNPKKLKKALNKNMELLTVYRPENAARFNLKADSIIRADIQEMKFMGITGVILPVYELLTPLEAEPLLMTMKYCRQENLKVIPVLYDNSITPALMEHYKTRLETERKKHKSSPPVPPEDMQIRNALNDWLEEFYRQYSSVLYRYDGKVPIYLNDTLSGEIYWGRPKEDFVARDTGFPAYLQEKYGEIYRLNLDWFSQYPDFPSIKMTDGYSPDSAMRMVYRMDRSGGLDLDIYRSRLNAQEYNKTITVLSKTVSSAMFGLFSDAIYGIESSRQPVYYSIQSGNWVAQRKGMLEEYILNKKSAGLEFFSYPLFTPEMDENYLVPYLEFRKFTPILLPEMVGICYIPNSPLGTYWESEGGWWGVPGVKARDYRRRNCLYNLLVRTHQTNALSGFSSWNDYRHFTRMTAIQKRELIDFLHSR